MTRLHSGIRQSQAIVTSSGGGIADKGYQGCGMVTPRKKPQGGELVRWGKGIHADVSSLRAPVERLVAHFKSWRIFTYDYRRALPHLPTIAAYDAARGLYFFSITWGFDNPDTLGYIDPDILTADPGLLARRDSRKGSDLRDIENEDVLESLRNYHQGQTQTSWRSYAHD